MPNPGLPYTGATKVGYLPWTDEGEKLVIRIVAAFQVRST
jgi:hypothetical protein